MLSSMNLTVIPFLLEALMSVEDVTKWNFGPVYVFQLNRLTKVHIEPKLGIYLAENVTATVWCRPKLSPQNIQDVLFCHAKTIIGRPILSRQKYTFEDLKNLMSETSIDINGKKFINFDEESTKIPDHIFQIEFGRQGVQNCYVKKQYYYDIITNIIDEFNVDTNFGIAAGNSTKTHKTTSTVFNFFVLYDEDTMRASNCNTTALIVYHTNTLSHYNKYERFMYEEYITKFRFRLRLLPISYTNPTGETLWIERDRKACTEQPDYILLDFEKWEIDNITKYTNLINIRDDNPKFTSYTQLEGYVYFEMLTTLVQFEEDVYLHLLRIEAAREELNTTEYD